MRKICRIVVKLVKNCGVLFSNLNTFLKSYVVGSSHYIFVFRLFWVPYIDTNPFLPILGSEVGGDLNFVSSTQCILKHFKRYRGKRDTPNMCHEPRKIKVVYNVKGHRKLVRAKSHQPQLDNRYSQNVLSSKVETTHGKIRQYVLSKCTIKIT